MLDAELKVLTRMDKREELKVLDWPTTEDSVGPNNLAKWYQGEQFNKLPSKFQLASQGMESVASGWLPAKPIISSDTRVLGLGSCFAQYFILWLAEHGFNKTLPDSPYNALLRYGAGFENPAVIAQQFRWAFDELDPQTLLWIDKSRHLIEATEEGKIAVRNTLEQTDVLIMTLGLSEVWYDNQSGEPLWRALTVDTYDPARHVFRVESVSDTIRHLETIEQIRKKHLPNLKIIFTVSPVRLKATFRPVSAISANSVSKAILRAAVDEFLRSHATALGKELFYFPSYEFVMDYFRDPFLEDNRHLCNYIPAQIIAFFARHYCEAPATGREAGSLLGCERGEELESFLQSAAENEKDAFGREFVARIAELERENAELKNICDERLQVIDGLDLAARERLEVINVLDAELKRRG